LLDIVLPKGERWEIPGRMNLSAGGTMVVRLLRPMPRPHWRGRLRERSGSASPLWTCLPVSAERRMSMRVWSRKVNANPSIRLLEESGRGDLILKIWRHTFSATGLL